MKISSNSYWISGPPIGIYDSLVSSGLVSNPDDLPKPAKTPNLIPEYKLNQKNDDKKHGKTSLSKSVSRKAVTFKAVPSVSSIHHAQPIKNKNNLRPISNSTTPTINHPPILGDLPKPQSIEDIAQLRKSSSEPLSKEPSFDDLFDITKTKNHITRKTVLDFQQNCRKTLDDIDKEYENIDLENDVQKRSEKGIKQLYAFFAFWNEMTLHIKKYNSDLAISSLNIKQFFSNYTKQFPKTIKHYETLLDEKEKEKNDLEKQNQELLEKLKKLEEKYESMKHDFDNLHDKNGSLEDKINQLTKELNDSIYSGDEQKTKTDDALFKLQKAEEKQQALKQTISQLTKINNDHQNHIDELNKTIDKFEEEGAGFKPLYINEKQKSFELLRKIDELNKEIEILKTPPETRSIGTEPIPELMMTKGNKKKSRRNTLFNNNKGELQNMKLCGETIEELESIQENAPEKQHKKKDITTPHPAGKKLRKSLMMNRNSGSLLDSPSPEKGNDSFLLSSNENKTPSTGRKAPSSIRGSKSSTLLISPEENKQTISIENDKVIKSPNAIHIEKTLNGIVQKRGIPASQTLSTLNIGSIPKTPEVEAIFEEKSTQTTQNDIKESNKDSDLTEKEIIKQSSSTFFHNTQKGIDLPSDYPPNMKIEIQPQVKSFVNCLFPLPVNPQNNPIPNSLLHSKENTSNKTFSWTLRQVIYIFKNGLEGLATTDKDFSILKIIQKVLISHASSEKVLMRITSDFFHSLNSNLELSEACRLLNTFINNDYTIVDFQFFNIIFNIVFDVVYPSFSSIINDPDIVVENDVFYIHEEIAKHVILTILRKSTLIEAQKQFDSIRHPTYVSLIKLWPFLSIAIDLFRSTHVSFHNQAKTLLFITGWSPNDSAITQTRFCEFMHIVSPFYSKEFVMDLWDKLQLANANTEDKEIYLNSFLKFCGDFPEVSNAIFDLDCATNFQSIVLNYPIHMNNALKFIRQRFDKVIPPLYDKLNSDLKHTIKPIITQIRNSFIKCDLDYCLSLYGRILQMIDFKMSEKNMYIVFSDDVSADEINYSLNILKMREHIASSHLSEKLNDLDEPSKIIKEQNTIIQKNQ